MPGAAEALLEYIPEATGIVSKETEADTGKLVESIMRPVLDKTYSICIMIPRDHIKASIMLNRNKNINAAICSSDADMQSAKENDANVIIIKHGEEGNAVKMFGDLFTEVTQPVTMQRQAPVQKIKFFRAKPTANQKITQEEATEAKEEEIREAQPRAAPEAKGIFKKLKYSLGIEE